MTTIKAPQGLSVASRAVWDELTAKHRFESFELVPFERSLRWFDRADLLVAEADQATDGRHRASLLKASMDASNVAIRFWRQLKFVDATAARRPGRPSDDNWSPARKLQAASKVG